MKMPKALYFSASLLLLSCTLACGEADDAETTETDAEQQQPVDQTIGTGTQPASGRTVTGADDVRVYIFGNSLVVHEVTPEPSEEKKVPHWLGLMAAEAGVQFAVDGRYGFMRDFADFSEIAPQWGFEAADSLWTDESVAFADIDYNRIVYTPTNFVQWQGPGEAYYDDPSVSPVSTTLASFDQIAEAQPDVPIYIYQGWADMAEYGSFPEGVDLDRYYADATSSYHDWFLDYHDRIVRARPNLRIKMIPVNTILTALFTGPLAEIPILDRYEDDAPHGQSTTYFLASLITYEALYQSPAAADFPIPSTVHEAVRENYAAVLSLISAQLTAYNHDDGTSRVY